MNDYKDNEFIIHDEPKKSVVEMKFKIVVETSCNECKSDNIATTVSLIPATNDETHLEHIERKIKEEG